MTVPDIHPPVSECRMTAAALLLRPRARLLIGAALLAIVWAAPARSQSIVINEFQAINASTLTDEDGDHTDWIELKNPGPTAVSITGWHLSDNKSQLTKWALPSTTINPGQFIIIFASGKDRATTGKQLHTNFKLGGDGEFLGLIQPDGKTIASGFDPYPQQLTDHSYGRSSAAGNPPAYFSTPTPGKQNSAGFKGLVSDTEISSIRGLKENPFSASVTCSTSGVTVRYTTDGSLPSLANGNTYSAPMTISKTTVLRTRAFKNSFIPSAITTKSFLFPADIIRQPSNPPGFPQSWGKAPVADYEMDPDIANSTTYKGRIQDALRDIPSLSLAMNVNDVFGPLGIYSNPDWTGMPSERLTSMEFIDPDQPSRNIHTDCGIRIQGGAGRFPDFSPKHSLSLRFRKTYGDGQLSRRLFPDSRVKEFDTLHLRSVFNNSWVMNLGLQRSRGQMLHDQFARDSLIAMGQEDACHGTFAHLYINGLYWGIYNIHERPSTAHYANWHGGGEDDYDARNGSTVTRGTAASWNQMVATVKTQNWANIKLVLDIDSYIDWVIINYHLGNQDLKTDKNWRTIGGGSAKAKWKFYSWDAERIAESLNDSTPRPDADPPKIFSDLVSIKEFTVRFGDRIQKHFFNDGALTTTACRSRYLQRTNEIDKAIIGESARWGDYRRDAHRCCVAPFELYTRDQQWVTERNRLLNFYFPLRNGFTLKQLQGMGLYPKMPAPQFDKHGGHVNAGYQLKMTAPIGKLYYTTDGSDPRLEGGAISPKATLFGQPITINQSTRVKIRAIDNGSWSALNEALFIVQAVHINELLAVNVNGIVDNQGEHEDWIELHNSNKVPIVVSGMYLTDTPANPVKWEIPSGHTINPGGTLLIWADEDGWQGPLHANFKLDAKGESVLLFHQDGKTLLSQITFGPQVADVSTGRLRDGGSLLVTFPDPSPNTSNQIDPCETRRYGPLDSTANPLKLTLSGRPALSQRITFQLQGGPPNTTHGLVVAIQSAAIALPFTASHLMVDLGFWSFLANPSNQVGEANMGFTVPQIRSLGKGVSLSFQGLALSPALPMSNGLEIRFCAK